MNFIRSCLLLSIVSAGASCFAAATLIEQAIVDAAADKDASSQYGFSVAIDGDTAVVGCPLEDIGENPDQGFAYVYFRTGTSWALQAKLQASDGQTGNQFGFSVAIDGDTILVGAPKRNQNFGAVYSFVRTGNTWTENDIIAESEGSANQFGFAVAVEGTRAMIGAPFSNDGFNEAGVVLEYFFDGANWTFADVLTASDAGAGAHYGSAIALNGGEVMIGAPEHTSGGHAYIYTQSKGWLEQANLSEPDSGKFGKSVALEGDNAVVGDPRWTDHESEPGAVYVYTRTDSTWTRLVQLSAGDVFMSSPEFGAAVALQGSYIIVGAPASNLTGTAEGAVYVFQFDGVNWNRESKYEASDRQSDDRVGSSVSFSGLTVVTGAPFADEPPAVKRAPGGEQGKAYILVLGDINDPVADDGSLNVTEDTPSNGTLTGDASGNPNFTFSIVTPPAKGTITFGSSTPLSQDYTYTPNQDENGSDTFTFKVNDGNVDSEPGTVAVTITPVNDPPTVSDDTLTTPQDTPVSGTLQGSDVDSQIDIFFITTQPQHGTVVLDDNSAGTFTYTPAAGYTGADSFQFGAYDDEEDESADGTITINVTGSNTAPTAVASTFIVYEDSPYYDQLLATDEDGTVTTFVLVSQPTHGTLTLDNAATGAFHYDPELNFHGTDSFTFKAIDDDSAESNVATVTLDFRTLNDVPIFQSVFINNPVTPTIFAPVSFSAVATDADGDTLTFTWNFGDGTTATGANVSHTYSADGVFTVTVTISDGNGGSVTQSFNVEVTLPALIIDKMGVKLSFAKPNSDSLGFSGSVLLPDGFTLPGKEFRILAGGIDKTITLDAKGKSPKGNDKLTIGKPKNSRAKYSFKSGKGNFAAALLDEGYTNTNEKNKRVFVKVIMIFSGNAYGKNQPQLYSAKQGKSGGSK